MLSTIRCRRRCSCGSRDGITGSSQRSGNGVGDRGVDISFELKKKGENIMYYCEKELLVQ